MASLNSVYQLGRLSFGRNNVIPAPRDHQLLRQSQYPVRNRIPTVHAPVPALDYRAATGTKVLLVPAAELRFSAACKAGEEFTIAAGPEAGFSDEEQAAFVDAGFVPARLGPRVLRTETAGIAALAALSALRGDF